MSLLIANDVDLAGGFQVSDGFLEQFSIVVR